MLKTTKIDKIIGIFLILASVFYIIMEYYTLSYAFLPIEDLYIKYTISKLAVPVGNIYFNTISTLSPKANLLNHSIILLGVAILIGNFVTIKKEISNNKLNYHNLCMIYFIIGIIFLTKSNPPCLL